MLNLIKYELVRKYKLFAIILVSTILGNLFLSVKFGRDAFFFYAGPSALVLIILFIVDVIKMYSTDLNKKTGYMLFMTPHSGYKIIASKVITAIIEGCMLIVFYLAIVLVNAVVIAGSMDVFRVDFEGIPFSTTWIYIVTVLVLAVVSAILFLMTVYTSITLRKSILDNRAYKGVISFGIFLLLNYVISNLQLKIYNLFNFHLGGKSAYILDFRELPMAMNFVKFVTPSLIISSAFIVLLGFVSGYLLEKKINL